MSKTIISVLVVGVVVVGGYFALTNKKAEAPKVADTKEDVKRPSDQNDKKIPFSEFVKQGGSYKCEVKQYLSDMENSGTVYISGGNIRGEYNTVAEGRKIDTSFIMKDGYSYTWSSMMPNTGFKIKIPDTEVNANTNAGTSGTYSWNANQIGDYNCAPWTAEASMFTLPSGIKFQEMKTQ